MSNGPGMKTAIVALLGGGVLGLVSSGRTWGSAESASALGASTAEVTGSDLVPLAPAASLVAMAAVLAVPALRDTGRRVVGAVLAAVGAGLAIMAAWVVLDLDTAVADWVERSPDASGAAGAVSVSPLFGWLTVLAGAVVLAGGALVVVRGPSWAGMGRKYERATPAGTEPKDAWDALDRGDDPTDR